MGSSAMQSTRRPLCFTEQAFVISRMHVITVSFVGPYGRGASLTDEGTEDFVDPLVSRMPGTIGPRTRDEVATAGL